MIIRYLMTSKRGFIITINKRESWLIRQVPCSWYDQQNKLRRNHKLVSHDKQYRIYHRNKKRSSLEEQDRIHNRNFNHWVMTDNTGSNIAIINSGIMTDKKDVIITIIIEQDRLFIRILNNPVMVNETNSITIIMILMTHNRPHHCIFKQ